MGRSWLLGVAVCLGCGGGWPAVDPAAQPHRAQLPDDAAVVLYDHTDARFDAQAGRPGLWVDRSVAVKILTVAGRQHGTVTAFAGRLSTVERLDVQVRTPSGAVRTYGLADAARGPAAPDAVLHSDQQYIVIKTDAAPGSVVQWRSRTHYQDPVVFQAQAHLEGPLPIVEASLTVQAPEGWALAHRAQAGGEAIDWAPMVLPGDGTRWRWTVADVGAFPKEPGGPPVRDMTRSVSVHATRWSQGAFPTNAAELAADLAPRYAARTTLPEGDAELAALLAKLPAATPARAAHLAHWVARQVRYCAIEVGRGGWIPHPPKAVLAHRYGDCKDQANLLVALWRAAGLTARPVLVHAHHGLPRQFGLPVYSSTFNHAIAQVDLPGGPQAFDPTTKWVPFGELPAGDQGATALPLRAKGGAVQALPVGAADDARVVVDLKPKADRGWVGTVRYAARGNAAHRLRGLWARWPEAPARALKAAAGLARGTLSAVRLEDKFTAGAPVVATAAIEVHGDGPGRLGVLAALDGLPPAGARRTPYLQRPTGERCATVRYALPDATGVGRLPPPVGVEGPGYAYRRAWTYTAPTLQLERCEAVRSRLVPAKAFPQYRQALAARRAAELRPVRMEVK